MSYPAAGRELVNDVLLPLRHVAWASNINNSFVGAYGYGIAISQAATYASMDQLGIAQYVTRLGLAFDDVNALAVAKQAWLKEAAWQDLRRYEEDLMVSSDWFEVFTAQNFVLEGLLFPLIYEQLNEKLNAIHGPVISLLTRFQREWFTESAKWVDAMLKAAAADNPANAATLASWINAWRARAVIALTPIAIKAFGTDGVTVLDETVQILNARAAKAGIIL
jgi:phenol hydroxylase P1 protein